MGCLKIIAILSALIIFFGFSTPSVFAASCGNGNCQANLGETCSTCPADCACTGGTVCVVDACVVPTNTPTPTLAPTATPTSAPAPTATPTPTGTTSTSGGSSSSSSSTSTSSTPSITYYPAISLIPFSPNPTNKTTLSFSGKVTIDQGSISSVEFSITDGAEWIGVTPSDGSFNTKEEFFSFTTSALAQGRRTIKVRAKSQRGVSSQIDATVTIITSPPVVLLDTFSPNPTKNTTPAITGRASSSLGIITRIDISLDGGKTWLPARVRQAFSLIIQPLEDGNYQILARAFDNAGNVGVSKPQTLIVDTIPPIIGGGMFSLGPQILVPDEKGTIILSENTEIQLGMSMKGGVTEAKIVSGNKSFPMKYKADTNLWIGKLVFDQSGIKPLLVQAVDGANNKSERAFNTIFIEKPGIIQDKKNGKPVADARVSVFVYEVTTKQWVLWDGESYGQQNPQKTKNTGNYSFMLPPGKYYVEVTSSDYHTVQSEILSLANITPLNVSIALEAKPNISFAVPFFGRIVLMLHSSWMPPQTIAVIPKFADTSIIEPIQSLAIGSSAPNFTLPTLTDKQLNITTFKGKKFVLTFLSPWSSLSLEQAAILSQIKEQEVNVLAVFLQESPASTQTFMNRGNYTFSIVRDNTGIVGSNYKVTLLPNHFFIDSRGKIYRIYNGVLTKEALVNIMNSMP